MEDEKISDTVGDVTNSSSFGSLWLSTAAFGFFLVIAYKYETSASFRYKFKFAVYVLYVSTVGLILLPICLFRPRSPLNVHFGVPLVRPVSKLLGIRWEVRGKEMAGKDMPCVLVCNHQSILDFMVLVELWPALKKCVPVAKKELLYVFPFGVSAWLCGAIYINRKNSKESRQTLSSSMEVIHKEKTKMWIFPEGTRTKRNDLLPFKKGAFHIAVQNKLPIIPVVVSPYTFINDEAKIFNSGKMIIQVLPPIDTSDYKSEDVTKLTETTYELMNKEFHRITTEVNTLVGRNAVNRIPSENGSAEQIPNGNSH